MRVLVAGDSWTAGWGVKSNESWSQLLPEEYEVTNIAESGSGNQKIARRILECWDYHDLIIVGWSSMGRVYQENHFIDMIELCYSPDHSQDLQTHRLEYFEKATIDTLRKVSSKCIREVEGLPCKVLHFTVFGDSLPAQVKHSADVSYMEYLANASGYKFLLDIPIFEYDYLSENNIDLITGFAKRSNFPVYWREAIIERELPRLDNIDHQLMCGHPSAIGHEIWSKKIIETLNEI